MLLSLAREIFVTREKGRDLTQSYWFCTPPPYFEAEYCLFCGCRRVAVARYGMICLVPVTKNPYTYRKIQKAT